MDSNGFAEYLMNSLHKEYNGITKLYNDAEQIKITDLKAGDFGFYSNPLRTDNDIYLFGVFSGKYNEEKKPMFYYIDPLPPDKNYYNKEDIKNSYDYKTGKFVLNNGMFYHYRRYFNIERMLQQ